MVNKLFPITNISIYVIIIIISYFLLSENDITKMKQITPFYNFYIKNIKAKLLKSIISVEPNINCPENSFPLLFYKYPGTKAGCLISKTNLEEGECSIWTKLFKTYENMEETSEKNFEILYTKKLCAIPFNENDYINNLNNKENEKLCGFLDTIENKFFVKNNEDCPINEIIINKENSVGDKYTNVEIIKDEFYLHYANEKMDENGNNKYLLTNKSLIISEGLPCINPGEINTFHIQYLLDKANETYICNTFIENERLDKRYENLSSINKKNLYIDNNINLENFYEYPFKEVNLTLYKLGYIGIDKNFISEILNNTDKFITNINSISNYYKYNKYIISLIFSFIFLVIINLIFKYFIVDITIYILSFILLIFDIANLTLNAIIFTLLKNFENLDKYYSNNHNDKIFNAQIKYINDIINDSKNINFKNLVGISIIIFLILFFDLINCCIFNNPNNRIIKTKRSIDYYLQNKKIYNSINVLKPFEGKKENNLKHKKEIELSKIKSINSDDDDDDNNIINTSKDEEEDILTNE